MRPLLKWFATTGGRGVAVVSAIASARREDSGAEAQILDFLEQRVAGGRADG